MTQVQVVQVCLKYKCVSQVEYCASSPSVSQIKRSLASIWVSCSSESLSSYLHQTWKNLKELILERWRCYQCWGEIKLGTHAEKYIYTIASIGKYIHKLQNINFLWIDCNILHSKWRIYALLKVVNNHLPHSLVMQKFDKNLEF